LLFVLFFAHPVHTESVLYIVGRADLLCLVLILFAALLQNDVDFPWERTDKADALRASA
jgi:hypothetical protein